MTKIRKIKSKNLFWKYKAHSCEWAFLSFREQRLGEYVDADMLPDNFKGYRSKVVNVSESRYKECATWSDVSKNRITYIVGFYSGSSGTTYYTFERINGKWYLTNIDCDA